MIVGKRRAGYSKSVIKRRKGNNVAKKKGRRYFKKRKTFYWHRRRRYRGRYARRFARRLRRRSSRNYTYITRTKMHQNNDVFTFDHQTLNSTFKIINIAGAGKWWPDEGEDSLNAARWNEYQCRKLVKVTFTVTDWRIYMERQMKRTITAASTLDATHAEFDADILPLNSIKIRWDFIHKYDVTKGIRDSTPLQFVADVNPLPFVLTKPGPQMWMEEHFYVANVSRKRGLYLTHKPRYTGNQGWVGEQVNPQIDNVRYHTSSDPSFRTTVPQPLTEIYYDNMMRHYSFHEILRIQGARPYKVDWIRNNTSGQLLPLEIFWSPKLVYYVEPQLPAMYLIQTTEEIRSYNIYVVCNVKLSTTWKCWNKVPDSLEKPTAVHSGKFDSIFPEFDMAVDENKPLPKNKAGGSNE